MQYIALNFISGSVWQMLRGGVIVTTAIFSKFFLRMVPKRNHYFGCAFAILGILIVGASNIIFSPKSDEGDADSVIYSPFRNWPFSDTSWSLPRSSQMGSSSCLRKDYSKNIILSRSKSWASKDCGAFSSTQSPFLPSPSSPVTSACLPVWCLNHHLHSSSAQNNTSAKPVKMDH